jgi:hypothetical protein
VTRKLVNLENTISRRFRFFAARTTCGQEKTSVATKKIGAQTSSGCHRISMRVTFFPRGFSSKNARICSAVNFPVQR